MRMGLITDIHLAPIGTPPLAWHNAYALTDATRRFQDALARCMEARVDAIALLGDLTHRGDADTLDQVIRLAAAVDLPVWTVPGNHDASERPEALAQALERTGAPTVRLARSSGVRGLDGVRIAGLSVGSRDGGFTAYATERLPVESWGDDLVLLLTHLPMRSSAGRLEAAGLKYAGDLEHLAEVAAPLWARAAPTVVLHGHLHVRDAALDGPALQIACAALIEPPYELTLLDVTRHGDQIVVHRQSSAIAEAPEDMRLPTLSPPEQSWRFVSGAWHTGPSSAETGT